MSRDVPLVRRFQEGNLNRVCGKSGPGVCKPHPKRTHHFQEKSPDVIMTSTAFED